MRCLPFTRLGCFALFLGVLCFVTRGGAHAGTLHAIASPALSERVIYAFHDDCDGGFPLAGVIADAAGVLYGTTAGGGCGYSSGSGAVYRLTPTPSGYGEDVLFGFGSVSDSSGTAANTALVMDASGSLYGTTEEGGGDQYYGTVYELKRNGSTYDFATLIDFFVGEDLGDGPIGGLNIDGAGHIYGTTGFGGTCGGGVAFRLNPTAIVHSFGCNDGTEPAAAMVADGVGNLFGTTKIGGTGPCRYHCGTVFETTHSKQGWKSTTIYTFAGGAKDGGHPIAPLLLMASGKLFGTTLVGGAHGKGTVFELTPAKSGYTERIVYSFAGASDGAGPAGPLVQYGYALYGTTRRGGLGAGTVYKMTPRHGTYQESVIHRFAGGADGAIPLGGLLVQGRALVGTTSAGGPYSAGTVYAVVP